MAKIKLEHLSHVYSAGTIFEKKALDDINLEINAGEFIGIIGHTGSGKSTLVKHMNGLMKATSGKLLVDGRDIWSVPSEIKNIRFKVGMVFQYPEYQLFEETVEKDIKYGLKNLEISDEEIVARVREAIEAVGISDELLGKSPFELSGGEKRRVAIAGVLAMRPEVLILDEPTAGLDPKGRKKILAQIKKYSESHGSAVLLISHSMEDIVAYTEKVLVMHNARVFQFDTVEKVFSESENLQNIGLDVPQITKICRKLNQSGFDISISTFSVQDAKDQIIKLYKEKR